MSDFWYCLLYYSFAVFVTIGIWFVFWKSNSVKRNPTLAKWGMVIVWLALAFNIAYTGMMGWNRRPETPLEMMLDIGSGVFHVLGLLMFYWGVSRPLENQGHKYTQGN